MNIHSKFLVHWTGEKDIEKESENIQALHYFERLRDDYQNGLFLQRRTEDVIRHLKIKYLLRLCFTEIKLSQAKKHANQYGKLGIGFSRDFIMNSGGRPVIYIPYEADICLLEECLDAVYEKSKELEDIHRRIKWILTFVKRMADVNKENGNIDVFCKIKTDH
ncbi:MAG TPA: abortive infection system antitoxin AbiGi family protein [Anaerolineaceae bacterium]|nr:abortive infection system antitoxin AbiGi family protein [Anaerolineaceae bacterium]